MDDQLKVSLATLVGAVAGGIFGCLYLTERGRRARDQIEPFLDEVVTEINRARGASKKFREVIEESRRAVGDIVAEVGSNEPWSSGRVRRTSG